MRPNVESRKAVDGRRRGPPCPAPAGRARDTRRRSVRDDANLLLGARARLDEQPKRRVRHHDHELRLGAQLRQHLRLVRRGLGEHRVQGHDERLREFSRKRQHVLAVTAAEDPELVLEQHDVDIEPPQHPSSSDVVAAHGLHDRREQAAPLWARRFVHDRDEIGALDPRPSSVARRSAEKAPIPQARGGNVETIAVRTRGFYERPRTGARIACIRAGSCKPARTDVLLWRALLVFARSRSSARLRLFLTMSLPLCDSPETTSGGLVRES